jgi:N-acetylglutamate synthase-like GNAT family acetyltransferase
VTRDRPRRLNAIPLAAWERDGLASALRKAGLPAADVRAPDRYFWRYETGEGVPVGFGGLEIHGEDALLRSLVTLPPMRGFGFGSAMVAALETEAALRGCHTIWLLTVSSEGFFARLGYARHDRDKVPEAIRGTEEFASLCPASAAVMMKRL